MKLPLQIHFGNIDRADWLEEIVRKRATRLDRFCGQIISCRVVIDMPHQHHRTGNQCHVKLEISVPGREISINREPGADTAMTDINAAVRDSFDCAERQLKEYLSERKNKVKTHEAHLPETG